MSAGRHYGKALALVLAGAALGYSIGHADSLHIPTLAELFGDINRDGDVNAGDAADILQYAAYKGSGGTDGLEGWMETRNAPEPTTKTIRLYNLDMSSQSDLTFNGEFAVLTFEVNENAAEGTYPVSFADTEIANWEVEALEPVTIDGSIMLAAEEMPMADPTSDQFYLRLTDAPAEPGERVDVALEVGNNPGFCIFMIDITYDSDALTLVNCEGGKDYGQRVLIEQK